MTLHVGCHNIILIHIILGYGFSFVKIKLEQQTAKDELLKFTPTNPKTAI